MSGQTPTNSGDLSPDAARRLDAVCNRFEKAWQGPTPPRIEDFADGWEGAERQALLRELIALDADCRRARGQVVRADEYRDRFPELGLVPIADGPSAAGESPRPVVPISNGSGAATVDAAAPSRPPPARVVRYFGDYELLDELGRGGMGVVYRAWQVSLKRYVAVKMILAGQLATTSEVQRFRTEAENAASLDHPNIVPIHEVGEHEGQCFFSMKLIDGPSLQHRMDPYTANPKAAAALLATVARAVHHAHQRGVLHRDLKPGNVLLDAQGVAHVADFGLAKRLGGEGVPTVSGIIIGTANYMAPEQAAGRNRELTWATDVYALGAVLYECLTGRPPLRGETLLDTLLLVQFKEPVPPGKVRPGVPRDLGIICLKCLSKNPQQRYRTAEALAEDLESFLEGMPIKGRDVGAVERAVRWVRRRPAQAALAGVGAVAAMALVGVVVGLVYGIQLTAANDQLGIANSDLKNTSEQLEIEKTEAEAQRTRARKAEGEARRYLYTATMPLVMQAEKDKNSGRVIQLLRHLIPNEVGAEDFRDWEWYHLWRKHHGEQSRLLGHTKTVVAVAFSPDDKLLASGSNDCTIKLWDVVSGKEVFTLTGHSDVVTSVAFSPDGKHLVSGSADATVRIWDTTTGKELRTLDGHTARVTRAVFCSDNNLVASSSEDTTVRIWNFSTGQTFQIFREHKDIVNDVAFTPNGLRIASAAKGDFRVWDPRTGKVLSTPIILAPDVKHDEVLTSAVAFSPDGDVLIAAYSWAARGQGSLGPATSSVTVWRLWGEVAERVMKHSGDVSQVAISADGTFLATASKLDHTVRIWDMATGREINTFNTGDGTRGVAIGSDNLWIASAGEHRSVLLWEILHHTSKVLSAPKMVDRGGYMSTALAFDSDGHRVMAANSNSTVIWDARSGEVLKSLPGPGKSGRPAWSPDGACIAGIPATSNSGSVNVTDVSTGQVKLSLEGEVIKTADLWGCAFSPDCKLVAKATGSKSAVNMWEVTTGKLVHKLGASNERPNDYGVSCVAFSPDGRLLAAGSVRFHDYRLLVWDVVSGKRVFAADDVPDEIYGVVFSPDSKRLAAVGGNGVSSPAKAQVRVWDVETWDVVWNLPCHTQCLYAVQFSPNGRRLVGSGGKTIGEVTMWDVGTGQEVWTMPDIKGSVFSVAFSPDGGRLVASANGTVQILDGTPLAETPAYAPLPDEK